MKILELRFKNLNSLYGEWRVDFTDPAFAEGLFAITGATGSGKTTILDALCLALYGQTPRLGKMTQSNNEVMSRQTGECFSEVLFETAKGTFRASWHQHRARKKAGAPLQSPRREVSDAAGVILAEKIKEVQERIDEVVGMGFDRFTRSILLAQGSFDSFLKANADERSPILEQITGTEIYTEISKLTHQRNNAENQKLNELMAGLEGIHLLDEDALEQIRFDLKQVQVQHTEEAATRDAAQAALECKARIESLENALEAQRAERETLRVDHAAFGPDAERLAAAQRAQPLAVAHAELVKLRADLVLAADGLQAAHAALPDLEAKGTNAAAAFEAAKTELAKREAEQKEGAPILTKTRALDTRIAGSEAQRKTERAALDQARDEQKALLEKEASNRGDLEQLTAQRAEAEAYQKEHARDAELVEHLSATLQSLEQLEQLAAEKNAACDAAVSAAADAKKAALTATAEAGNLSTAQQTFTEAEAAREAVRAERAPLLDGTDWRGRLEALRRRIFLEQRMLKTRATLAEKTAEAADAEQELGQKRTEQEGLQREQGLLVGNLRLQQKIESLETEREALADGRPCPLCGSLEHPYAAGLPAKETSSLEKINATLSTVADRITTLTEQHAGAHTARQALQLSLLEDEAELEPLAPGDAEEAEQIERRIAMMESLERKERELSTALDTARDALNRHQLAEQNARRSAEMATEKSTAAEAQRAKAEAGLHTAQTDLIRILEPFGVALSRETKAQLTARRDQWIVAEKKTAELTHRGTSLHATLAGQAEEIEKHETRIARQTETLDKTESDLDTIKSEREVLFGDRVPDLVEQEIQTVLTAARKTMEAARSQLAQCEQALLLAQQNIAALETGNRKTRERLDEAAPPFGAALSTAGFENEAAYQSAHLADAEQSRLASRAEELKQRHTRLAALEAEKTQQLQTERGRKLVETSPDEHAGLITRCDALQQRIGTFNGQLKQNQQAVALHQSKLGDLEKQRVERDRWNQLHELIGSADGKKFRNFAQGLTFELMVSHANQQLTKMSDRYLLVRDQQRPLDLNVVDNYQAGEIRPVATLSGGESFVVSLSLALGLSRMTSKHIRVDSLFLDEGFGTLDEDALETALEALAELKQDGKLIGVISHVGALKERIGTQINVQTHSGGRSRLSGTGITEF